MQENTILISVGGKKARCFVDTGAQISIASLDFLRKTNLKMSSLKSADILEIIGVGNEHHRVMGILEISFQFLMTYCICHFSWHSRFQSVSGLHYH